METAMEFISAQASRIISIFSSIQLVDVIDMLLLAYVLYKGFKLIRETRALQLVTGIFIIIVLYALSAAFHLKVMTYLFTNFFQVGLIAVIVVFQPELRRVLERVGRADVKPAFSEFLYSEDEVQKWSKAISEIADAVSRLSQGLIGAHKNDGETRPAAVTQKDNKPKPVGALIVIAHGDDPEGKITGGTVLDCEVTESILTTIFFVGTSLHDGAVIIKDARVHSAGCFLPLPKRETTVSRNYGSRHRAAIGMSEQSDAIVIVVSEETGAISIARNGQIQSGLSKGELESYLRKEILPEDGRGGGIIGRIKSWRKESRNGGSDKRESEEKQAAD